MIGFGLNLPGNVGGVWAVNCCVMLGRSALITARSKRRWLRLKLKIDDQLKLVVAARRQNWRRLLHDSDIASVSLGPSRPLQLLG